MGGSERQGKVGRKPLFFSLLAQEQARLDEIVDVSIQNAFDISDIDIRSGVFDHAVRVKHVGPDLISPGNI